MSAICTNGQTVKLEFKTGSDTELVAVSSEQTEYGWLLEVKHGALLLTGNVPGQQVDLDMEDTADVRDQQWHSVLVASTAAGSKIFLDGYQVFSSTADLSPVASDAQCRIADNPLGAIRNFTVLDYAVSEAQAPALAVMPQPFVEFSAAELDSYDVADLQEVYEGTIFVRFRTRGVGQGGTLLAASGEGSEKLKIAVNDDSIIYEVAGTNNRVRRFSIPAAAATGTWQDLAISAKRGAIDFYLNGYLIAHCPGKGFFANVAGLDRVVIGQNCAGLRFFGEARTAAIYDKPLNDSQLKLLSGVEPAETMCLFEKGYKSAVSYRIPSLLTTSSGVVIAGADQRETDPNDAPNSINFVIRRSLDSGETFTDMQTVLSCPGEGAKGASVIDSCPVQDPETGRIFVLIDHFPGGIGQPNNQAEVGQNSAGEYYLFDRDGARYVWHEDGSVSDADGNKTSYHVADTGEVTVAGEPRGNVFLAVGVDPNESLLTARTSFLWEVHSDDDGETWSQPRCINYQVKEEWMPFLGTGPGNGIAITTGPHRGRLVIPVYYNNHQCPKAFSAAVVYSDDHGQTWTRGKSPNDGRITPAGVITSETLTDEEYATHEATIAQRANGDLVMLMRNQSPVGKVARTISTDGGESWGEVDFVEEIPEIFCQPNVINAPTPEYPERMVFANASQMRPYRGNGVLRVSLDGGKTWPFHKTLVPEHYVYQCMVVLPDGSLGVLWERETQGLYFTKLPADWVEAAS